MWLLITPRRRKGYGQNPRGNLAAGGIIMHLLVAGDSFDTTTSLGRHRRKDTMKASVHIQHARSCLQRGRARRAGDMVVPGGEYRREVKDGKTLVVPGSFTPGESKPAGSGCSPGGAGEGICRRRADHRVLFIIGAARSWSCRRTGAIAVSAATYGTGIRQETASSEILHSVTMTLFASEGAFSG